MPGSVVSQMPPQDDDPQRRQRDLERQAREQASARSGQAMQIGAGGIVVTGGGSITIEGTGALNVGSGALNSAGAITAATDITAGGDVTAGGAVQGADLVSTGPASVAGALSAGSVSSGGAVSGSTGRFDGGLFSIAAYSTIISGTRVANWTQNDGTIGTAPSSARFKTNITDADLATRAQAILGLAVKHYNYLAEIDKQQDDPAYKVHLEVGMIAEDLHAAGLWEFVIYERDENGVALLDDNGDVIPFGIHYELFGMAVLGAAQYIYGLVQVQAEQISALTARLDKAGL